MRPSMPTGIPYQQPQEQQQHQQQQQYSGQLNYNMYGQSNAIAGVQPGYGQQAQQPYNQYSGQQYSQPLQPPVQPQGYSQNPGMAPYPPQPSAPNQMRSPSMPGAAPSTFPNQMAPYPPSSTYPAAVDPRYQGQPAMQSQQQQQSRLNPMSMVPTPVAVNEADQSKFNETAFVTSTIGSQSPPLTSTMAKYIDDGNSSNRFIRLTSYSIPCSEDIMHSTRIPLALVMQPFAQRPSYEDPIPLVDFGPEGPIRCSRCRAYVNPFMTWAKGGRVYVCNICYMQNDVRDSYFCGLDMTGRRADAISRPELSQGTIDVVAPLDYLSKKPSKATILFALETTRAAVQSGSFMASIQTIREFITNEQTKSRYSRVGLMTFDKNIQYYDLRMAEPQVLVMSDVNDPFVPLHAGLFVDPLEAQEAIFSLLDRLPKLFSDSRALDCCFGAAISAAYEALKSTGGRVLLMASTLPSHGLGCLKPKEAVASGPPSNEKVQPDLLPQGDFYRELAKRCAISGVSINIVATPSSSIDMATLHDLTKATSGRCCVYPKFSFDAHLRRLTQETVKFLLLPTAYDCIAKVRCGSGLQNDLNFGHFTISDAGDMVFAALSSEQTFATTIIYDSRMNENERVCFQLAVLYVNSEGQPRIRIHNICLSCTSDITAVFRNADLDALVNLQAKQVACQFQEQPLPFIAAQISAKTSHILAAYRKHCASNMSAGQLVLPDALKLLPLYSSCLLKQPLFQTSCSSDYRVAAASQLTSSSFESLPSLLYPRLFSIHNILDVDESRYYPPCLRASSEFIEPHGVYLLENSSRIVIWVGQQAESSVLEQLFGITSINDINPNMTSLPELNNPISNKTRMLIQKLQYQRPQFLWLSIIRNGLDPWEHEWAQLLIENAQPAAVSSSYLDYLCRIHGQIQQELTATPTLSERAAMLNFLH